MADNLQPSGLIESNLGRSPRRWLWRRYRIWVLIFSALLLAVACVGSYFAYHSYQHRRAIALFYEARKAEKNNRLDDALRVSADCLALAPDIVEAYTLQAHLLSQRGQTQEADRCIGRMVAANPKDARAYACRGQYRLAAGQVDAAAEDVKKGSELAPDDHNVLVLAVEYWTRKGKFEIARTYARRLQTLFPGDPWASGRLAELEASLANYAASIPALESGLRADPANTKLLFALVNSLCDQQRTVEAQAALTAATRHHDPTMLKLLSARISYAQRQWQQAYRLFEEVRPALRENRTLLRELDYWLGICYGETGSHARQVVHWRRAIAANPDWLPLRRGMIDALLSVGQLEDAIGEAQRMRKECHPTAADDRRLVHLLIVQALSAAPAKRQWQDAQTLLEGVAKAEPDSLQTVLLRAELLLAQNRFTEAESILCAARKGSPQRLELWLAPAVLAYRQDDDAAAQWLKTAKTQCGDSASWRIAQAAFLLWQHAGGNYRAFHRLAEHTSRMSAADEFRLNYALAYAAYHAGDYLQAARLCQKLGTSLSSPPLWTLQLQVALRNGRSDDVDRLLATIERTAGHGAHWHYGKAVYFALLVREGRPQYQSSLGEHLAKAREMAPFGPYIPLLTAEVNAPTRPAVAAANYLEAVGLGESCPLVIASVLHYLYQQQRYLQADLVIQELIARPPPPLLLLSGGEFQVALPPDDLSQAEHAARQAAAGSRQAEDHRWLGQVLEVLGRQAEKAGQDRQAQLLLKEANSALQQARTLQPRSPAAWAAALGFSLRSKRPDDARQLLRAAQDNVPAAQLPYLLGQGWEMLGNPAAAEKHWETVLLSASNTQCCDDAAEFYIRTKQEPSLRLLLDAIAAGKRPATDTAMAWARRTLAWMLAGGSPEDRQRAIALLDQSLAGTALPQDLQLKAALLISAADPAARRQALEIMEAALGDWHSTPQSKFFLAQRYLAEGDLLRARNHLVELVLYFPEEPPYLSLLIQVLFQRKEIPLAESLLRRLERLAPKDFLTVGAEAELLFSRGQFAAIPALFCRYIAQLDDKTPDPALLQDRPAAALKEFADRAEELGEEAASAQLAKAVEVVRQQSVAKRPEVALALALQLARRGELDEGLGWLEQTPEQINSEALAETNSIYTNPICFKAGKQTEAARRRSAIV